MRANVLLPTATLPAMPITYGVGAGRLTEERVRGRVQVLRRRDVQVQQARERQVDRFDFGERNALVEAAQLGQVLFAERERRRSAEPGPLLTGEVADRSAPEPGPVPTTGTYFL